MPLTTPLRKKLSDVEFDLSFLFYYHEKHESHEHFMSVASVLLLGTLEYGAITASFHSCRVFQTSLAFVITRLHDGGAV